MYVYCIIIGTHDIQNVTVAPSSLHPGQIRVTGDFVNGSTATGVLLIVYSLTNESDVHYVAKPKEQDVNVSYIVIITLFTGN